MSDKYIKYRGFETSDEVLEAIMTLVGTGCFEREREVADETDEEKWNRLDTCNCEFCRVWAKPTDEEIREVEKQLSPGEYYWGIEKVVIK